MSAVLNVKFIHMAAWNSIKKFYIALRNLMLVQAGGNCKNICTAH